MVSLAFILNFRDASFSSLCQIFTLGPCVYSLLAVFLISQGYSGSAFLAPWVQSVYPSTYSFSKPPTTQQIFTEHEDCAKC